ncbi:NAD(P)H-binding protein [Alloalcanivorax mobilis]|uniref:NAD(P)H-binding protein n=1 Tax=Alloalcanivorax mobilis TaxID=2019569 RepID=UPI001E4E275E|nr:NAD(P)H-binding protein [Alloalcanivorax mobilis]
MMTRTALILGATGLVGGQCLRLTLASQAYDEVRVLTRRPLAIEHPRLRQTVIDPDHLDQHHHEFQVDDLFCALGTTMKRAGSREAFRRVDEDLVVRAARLALQAGVQRCLVVSAVNARARSPFFYARVKGEMEQRLETMGLPMLAFMQPSLLLGERSEARRAEALGARLSKWLQPVTRWTDAHWLPVQASLVAQAMVGMALLGPSTGTYRVRYRDFPVFAGQFKQRYPQTF